MKNILNIVLLIKDAMIKNNLNISRLATLSGVHRYTVSNILKGESKRFDYISKLASALDVSLDVSEDDSSSINYKSYLLASNTALKVFIDKKTPFSKKFVEYIIFLTYSYIEKNKVTKSDVIIGYIHALLEKETDPFAEKL